MAQIPSDRLVTIYGGSGFVGRHLVRALAKRGWRIRVAVRRPDLAGHLQPLGVVGQVMPVQANLRFPDSVARAAEGASAIVNLVGILYQSGAQRFDAVQAEGADAVAKAAKQEAARLVQMSRSAPIRIPAPLTAAPRRSANRRPSRRDATRS